MRMLDLKNKIHHENWPTPIFYAPVFIYYIYNSLKFRKFNYFAAVNPGLETGGLCGFSKYESFKLLPKDLIPKTILLSKKVYSKEDLASELAASGISFPVVLKPDQGERGFLVSKVCDLEELYSLVFNKSEKINFLIQDYVEGPLELGVFLIKQNDFWAVSSIMSKKFLSVEGDGVSNLETLIEKNERGSKFFESGLGLDLKFVPTLGETVVVEPIGNHSRGTEFVDECSQIDSSLSRMFNEKLKSLEGVNYCRLDIRASSWTALKSGDFKLMELNGVSAEPGHIYAMNVSLSRAYKDLFSHWNQMSQIAKEQIENGRETEKFFETIQSVRKHFKKKRELFKMQNQSISVLGCANLNLHKDPESILNSFSVEELINTYKDFELKCGYERTVIFKDKKTEVVFCHWKEDAKSVVHDHPGVDCTFKCLRGEILEIRSMGQEQNVVKENEFAYINDSMGAHQMLNVSGQSAYSLHVYQCNKEK